MAIPTSNANNPAASDTTPIEMSTPIQFVPGVGPSRGTLFQKLGIHKAADLLFYFPRSYRDTLELHTIGQLKDGEAASVLGKVVDKDQRITSNGGSIVGILIELETGGFVRCVWFNQPFRYNAFPYGTRIIATGPVKKNKLSAEMRHPDTQVLQADEPIPSARPSPIYGLTEGLQQRHIISAVGKSLDALIPQVEEALPESLRRHAFDELIRADAISPEIATRLHGELMSIQQSLELIHRPESLIDAEAARMRFGFQELFIYQLALAQRRHQSRHAKPAPIIESSSLIHSRILKRFPFELTPGQAAAIEDVRHDMAQSTPMNRLVQGDVGSGKTAIAQYAMLSAVANKYQAAFMVPTELLARQHFQRLRQQLEGSQVMIELLSGSISQRDRNELLQRIAIGTVDIVVGTQALLSDAVEFASLGLVVIDEQHKFGVEQRAALRQSRTAPHYLVLSATPIPRTIAMTAFGDLDLSIIKDRPHAKTRVHTYLGNAQLHDRWWKFVADQLVSGRQAYVVTARLEDDEAGELAGVQSTLEWLSNGPLAGWSIESVHGRFDGDEKQARLDRFANGQTRVLVATTVVEVGIDVPNATVMTILDADRLGLAQLHQLRGRVSRGTYPGYVCLFPSKDDDETALERLKILTTTNDGFSIAEHDLRLRGPGDLIGKKQIGLPPFRVADLLRDAKQLMSARQMAQALIEQDPKLDTSEFARLKRLIQSRHGDLLQLGDVG